MRKRADLDPQPHFTEAPSLAYKGEVELIGGTLNRRHFLAAGGAAGLVAATGAAPKSASAAPASQPVCMKLGDQTAPTNDTHLKYLARYGVRNICGYPEIAGDRLYATVDELKRMMDMAAKYGISIDCTRSALPRVKPHRSRKASGHHARAEP